jgi:hypothetical protein
MGAVIKTITKGADKLFEEVIEKPGKKIIQETKETITGTSKEDYRAPVSPEVTPEVTPEIIEDETPTITTRYATRGKRSGQGGTIMEGYGVTTRPASKRSVT